MQIEIIVVDTLFLSTLSLRRATRPSAILFNGKVYFYPRSPCGERPMTHMQKCCVSIFLSTLSLRRATLAGPSGPAFLYNFYPRSPCGERPIVLVVPLMFSLYFYPRSPCGERPHYDNYNLHCVEISIHALLAESDLHYDNYNLHCVEISIHALLAESDRKPSRLKSRRCVFLSTLSLRRATH